MRDTPERQSAEPNTLEILETLFPPKTNVDYHTKSKGIIQHDVTVVPLASPRSYLILATSLLEPRMMADHYACDIWEVTPDGLVRQMEFEHYNDHGKGSPSLREVIDGLNCARDTGYATYPVKVQGLEDPEKDLMHIIQGTTEWRKERNRRLVGTEQRQREIVREFMSKHL